MANSINFFGQKSGSTKSLTFAVRNGKQIVKDRVYKVRNTRSQAQMEQRCRMATVSLAYRVMQDIVNHSFQGQSGKNQNMSRFIKVNLDLMKLNMGKFKYARWQQKQFCPGFYIVSEGQLQAVPDWTPAIVDGNLVFNSPVTGGSLTEAEICEALGLEQIGDMVTLLYIVPSEINGYVFGFLRIQLDSLPSASVLAADTAMSCVSFLAPAGVKFSDLKYTAANNKLHIIISAIPLSYLTPGIDYVGYANIRSRKVNDGYKYSPAQIKMGAGFVASSATDFANAVATYPQGESYILHGGSGSSEASDVEDNSGSQGSSSSSSGSSENNGSSGSSGSNGSSSSVASPTISGTTPFDDSTQVTISGPAGATIKYTTNGIDPTATYGNDYEDAITLNASATVKAVAIVDGVASEVATKAFVKNGSQGGSGEEGM